jgi:rhodanese-related sulfurtransferase
MRCVSALVALAATVLVFLVEGRFCAASAQHQTSRSQAIRTIDARQLAERLSAGRGAVLIDVRMAHERMDWSLSCAQCTIVTLPFDFDNDGWSTASAGERYIHKIRTTPNLIGTLQHRDVVVLCLAGVRAEAAAHALVQLGLDAVVLTGGLNGLNHPWLLGKREPYR